MSNNKKENRRYSIKKTKNKFNPNLNKPQTLEEYFLVIGIDPKLSLKEYLYNTSITKLNDYYSKDDFKPKILSKFPPINKKYINIDSSIIELLFPDGYKLEKFSTQPQSVVEHFLLDNSFYSIDYPLKYVTCLKIYESLEKYFELKSEINDKLSDDYFHDTLKINTGKKNKKNILNDIKNLDDISIKFQERFKSDFNNNLLENDTEDNYRNYYFPKILCLVSTQHFFKEQKKILKQIYQYYIEKIPKKIPIEKQILTVLFNIPMPPKGLLEIEYNLKDNYPKIKIKEEKMNKIKIIEDELCLIFSKFSINKIIIILKYILFETKTIVFSTKINELTFFIYGLISILFPLHYSFQVSSSIPDGAYDVLESISPYILGINKKYNKTFFKENKIDISDLTLFIIDLDDKSVKIAGKDTMPEFPKNVIKPLREGLEGLLGIKNKKNSIEKKDVNWNLVNELFYDFFVNLLSDYDLYLKKDYFKNKLSNTGIKNLFKIKEFIDSHSHNEREFFKKFSETQMFSDFIYKKMIPKNVNEKLEILLVDETLIKKKNKKLFKKKKTTFFLDSKEYEHSHTYEIPHARTLSKKEKNFFINISERNDLLLYGQKINEEKDKKTNDIDYSFEYFLFPILNKNFFESPPFGEYFLSQDLILFSDVDRANTDILSKTMNGSNKIDNKKSLEEEMQNYIYLTYIELWAYGYWYIDFSEKDNKFNQMLEILNKITHHEVELFDHLFEALNKFKEEDKILQLYDCLLNYKIVPSSSIYSIVNSLLMKSHKMQKSYSNKIMPKINNDIMVNEKKSKKRTFHSTKEENILGDKVIFYCKQPCPECDKEIDMVDLSLNFKNMKKEIFWTKCPICNKEILPKIGVLLGNEIINNNKKNNTKNNTSNYTKFILHSPYELKNNIKNIINKDGFSIFHLELFKEKYPSLFWSCIWYFKIYKIDLDIILPYEKNTLQNMNTPQKSLLSNIISRTKLQVNIERHTDYDIKKIKIKNKYKNKSHIKKYPNDKLIINNVISIYIEDNPSRSSDLYHINSISSLFDLYRKSTISSINKSKSNTIKIIDSRNSADNSKIELNSQINNITKKQTMKINMPYKLQRVRLNTSSKKSLLSASPKSRIIFENIKSQDLLSIKENEDYYFTSPFTQESMKEQNYEDDFYDDNYTKKTSTNIFNFDDDENDIYENKKNRSFSGNKKSRITIDIYIDRERKRNKSTKNKKLEIFSEYN